MKITVALISLLSISANEIFALTGLDNDWAVECESMAENSNESESQENLESEEEPEFIHSKWMKKVELKSQFFNFSDFKIIHLHSHVLEIPSPPPDSK
ncbi:MAG: hypothetical protein AAF487_11830 [Bacteroidota bacterium]